MTDILENLNAAKIAAMKAKISVDEENRPAVELRLEVLRSLIGEIDRDSKEKKPRGVLAVLKSEQAKRLDSVDIYAKAGENARAEKEQAEASIIAEFLPKSASEAELKDFVSDFVAANGLAGGGGRAVGQVMSALREKFENFDGKLASTIAKSAV